MIACMKSQLYIIELENSNNFAQYQQYMSFLCSDKQSQIYKFISDIDRKLSLFSDLLVRVLICQFHGVKNKDLVFDKTIYGKPYLVDFPDFHYNISHTRHAIVVGLSDKPIGVDFEKIELVDLSVANRFFCKEELNYIFADKELSHNRFYEVWTKKEAYIKWNGRGLSFPLRSFDVTDEKIASMLFSTEVNNYIVSMCSKSAVRSITTITLNELCQMVDNSIFFIT